MLDLLTNCRLDFLFISETKIDKSVPSSLLLSPHYCIIRRDRKHGARGLLAYTHTSAIARRQLRIEPENIGAVSLSVKGTANSWFYVCPCYQSPNKCKVSDFISACAIVTDKMFTSRSEIILLADMNIDMLHTIHDNNLHTETSP